VLLYRIVLRKISRWCVVDTTRINVLGAGRAELAGCINKVDGAHYFSGDNKRVVAAGMHHSSPYQYLCRGSYICYNYGATIQLRFKIFQFLFLCAFAFTQLKTGEQDMGIRATELCSLCGTGNDNTRNVAMNCQVYSGSSAITASTHNQPCTSICVLSSRDG